MKIPLKWLAEYVDLKGLSDKEISDGLTMSGTENEIEKGVEFPKIVVGEIKEISAHPNADKVRVTKTDVGKVNGGVLQIVCGAPNIEVGQKVPVALPGAPIGDFVIEKTKIRGVESNGMLASEQELGISEDHSGIMILDPRAKIGQKLEKVLNIGGTVLEAEVTPNRGDCLSMTGIAREAAAALNRKFLNKKLVPVETKSSKTIKVEVQNKEKCPRYIAKVIEGVKVSPSPKWMQERLSACGVRPINNIVDVTNYVMLEMGQPLHAFDATKINEAIIVRSARAGEKLVTLDGNERKLDVSDLVIADEKKAIALAGVMGGLNSEVDEKTTTIVLEAAVFHPTSVRKTAQKLALRSEASNRFEKGIPLNLPEYAIERAAELILEDGGKAGKNTDELLSWIWIQHVGLEMANIPKFLGIELGSEKVLAILHSLGFEAKIFDIKKEARAQVGKPYVWGASFKTHGDMAFDCSYLTDYLYSLIGRFIGHTALAQFESGRAVNVDELQPGDLLFLKGKIEKSATDHYFENDGRGNHKKIKLPENKEVGHVGIYIGGGRVVHASHYSYDNKTKKWSKLTQAKAKVVEENVEKFLNHPEFLGARRYVEDINYFIATIVPWWRLDIKIEEDILEEIGRMYGYTNFPSTLPSGPLPYSEENPKIALAQKIRTLLSGVGLTEVYTYSFISKQAAEYPNQSLKPIKVDNPINPEQEWMRTSLAPSLLEAARKNQENRSEIKIYEIASIYLPSGKVLPDEVQTLGICLKPQAKKADAAFAELKGALELLAERLNLGKFEYKPTEVEFLSKGQTAGIYYQNQYIGFLGLVSPKAREDFGLKHNFAFAEVNLGMLAQKLGQTRVYKTISRFPEAERHFNLLVSDVLIAAEIESKLNNFHNSELLTLSLEDIYSGENLPEGKKSVTIKAVFGSTQKTLKDEEIAEAQKQLLSYLKKSLGGELRV